VASAAAGGRRHRRRHRGALADRGRVRGGPVRAATEVTERRIGSASARTRAAGNWVHRPDERPAHAADALVHSTAGLTVLEAMIRGCPVISIMAGAWAHIRANNEAYRRFGLAEVAVTREELARALRRRAGEPPGFRDHSFAELPSAASLVLDAPGRRMRGPARAAGSRRGMVAAALAPIAPARVRADRRRAPDPGRRRRGRTFDDGPHPEGHPRGC